MYYIYLSVLIFILKFSIYCCQNSHKTFEILTNNEKLSGAVCVRIPKEKSCRCGGVLLATTLVLTIRKCGLKNLSVVAELSSWRTDEDGLQEYNIKKVVFDSQHHIEASELVFLIIGGHFQPTQKTIQLAKLRNPEEVIPIGASTTLLTYENSWNKVPVPKYIKSTVLPIFKCGIPKNQRTNFLCIHGNGVEQFQSSGVIAFYKNFIVGITTGHHPDSKIGILFTKITSQILSVSLSNLKEVEFDEMNEEDQKKKIDGNKQRKGNKKVKRKLNESKEKTSKLSKLAVINHGSKTLNSNDSDENETLNDFKEHARKDYKNKKRGRKLTAAENEKIRERRKSEENKFRSIALLGSIGFLIMMITGTYVISRQQPLNT